MLVRYKRATKLPARAEGVVTEDPSPYDGSFRCSPLSIPAIKGAEELRTGGALSLAGTRTES